MAQEITAFQFSNRFKKEYKRLPKEIQEAFDRNFQLFLNNMSHPSLRVKRIQGTADRWEASITAKYRFTFQWVEDTLLLRAIGKHDILQREAH